MEETFSDKNNNLKVRQYLIQFLNENQNIFYEDKLSNIHFISGFALAKKLNIYLFTDHNTKNSNWLKLTDKFYESKIKFSEFEFMKITMEYMLRERKRNYEALYGKKASKLSMIFDKNQSNSNIKNDKMNDDKMNDDKINSNNNNNNSYSEFLNLGKFQSIIVNIKQYFLNSPPKNFENIKNILYNFSEQNLNFFSGNSISRGKGGDVSGGLSGCAPGSLAKLDIDSLSFLLLKELLNKEIIINKILEKLIDDKIICNIVDIQSMMSFYINLGSDDENLTDQNKTVKPIKHTIISNKNSNIIPKTNTITNSNRIKNHNQQTNFHISETAEEEYRNIILNCPAICNFVKKTVTKILSNFSFQNIDKLPTNPCKFKNHVYSFVNNQELLRISKKILNLEFDKLLNILTDGIIIEFMRNNLVIFLSDKKIHYNLNEIETEKFRLSKDNDN
jgi:hypothetical protein